VLPPIPDNYRDKRDLKVADVSSYVDDKETDSENPPAPPLSEIMKPEDHMRIKTMMLLLFCFGLGQFGYAQAQSGTKDQPQGDLSSLRTDVRRALPN